MEARCGAHIDVFQMLFNWGLEERDLFAAAGDCNACEGSQAIRSGQDVQLVRAVKKD